MGFRKPKKALGLDIGTHSVKTVLVSRSMGRLWIEKAAIAYIDRSQFSVDPVAAQTRAIREALDEMPKKQSLVVASLSGQTVVVRYPRLTNVPREQLASAVAREAVNNIPYDMNDVYMDWTLLEEFEEEGRRIAKILVVAATRDVVDMRLQILSNAEVECGILTVDSLALADAGEVFNLFQPNESVALIDIGLTSSSIQFIKQGVSNFIRDVNWGARELIQAIAKANRCSYEEALYFLENYKAEDKVPEAIETEVGLPVDGEEMTSAKTDRNMFSPLDPLEDEDAFEGFSSGVNDIRRTDLPLAKESEARIEDIVAAPLARLAVELRRSFDYYEHQLYEQPVTRVLLCGGLAEFPLLTPALEEELGFGIIEIMVPKAGFLQISNKDRAAPLLEHPCRFIVALGLAARGMTEL